MDRLRSLYRNLIFESLLLLAVVVQIWTGIRLFVSNKKRVNSFFEKLQLWSGLYLAVFFLIHLSAVFAGRYILDLDTNFYFGAAGLNTFPHLLFFLPYYGLGILAFFGHIAAIHAEKMKQVILGLTPKQQSSFILAAGLMMTIAIFYGLTGHFKGVDIPLEYHILLGK